MFIYLFTFRKQLDFKVPGVPLIPTLAMIFNVYLMLKLPGLTWARLGVWLLIGKYRNEMVVYTRLCVNQNLKLKGVL